jgi:protein involved in polysaccharide export with SLBB domain
MSPRQYGAVLAAFALALGAFVGGCQSPSSLGSLLAQRGNHAAAKSAVSDVVLAPGMEIEWHVKTAQATPGAIRAGRSVVGPDGRLEMGPYGQCPVGGLTPPQAAAALEKHLAKFLRSPSVAITTQAPVAPAAAADLAWRPAATSVAPNAVAAADASKSQGSIHPVGFQAVVPSGDKAVIPPGDKKDKDNAKDNVKKKDDAKDKDKELIPAPRNLAQTGPLPPPDGHPEFGPGPWHAAPNECHPTLLPTYVIGPTDVLMIASVQGLKYQPVAGPHLVGPDGTVRVGIYGSVLVAGHTLDEARAAIAGIIFSRLDQEPDSKIKYKDVYDGLSVDVIAYNSKIYYVIFDGGGQGDQALSLPVTGNDTVLSALAKVNGMPPLGSKHHMWVARLTCPGAPDALLPVDWIGITKRGEGATNWQIMPGDRIYVQADPWFAFDRVTAKVLSPFERIMGAVLLGSQTVNSIRSGSVGGTR